MQKGPASSTSSSVLICIRYSELDGPGFAFLPLCLYQLIPSQVPLKPSLAGVDWTGSVSALSYVSPPERRLTEFWRVSAASSSSAAKGTRCLFDGERGWDGGSTGSTFI